MLTMLLLELINDVITALSIRLQFEHFKTQQVLRCLGVSFRVYSLPHSRHATLSFLFSEGISIRKEKKWDI